MCGHDGAEPAPFLYIGTTVPMIYFVCVRVCVPVNANLASHVTMHEAHSADAYENPCIS